MLKNLKLLREQAGVTQKQLAEAVSVSQQSINKYENHNIEPDIDTLTKIADFFHTSVDHLIGHSPLCPASAVDLSLGDAERILLSRYRRLTAKQKACLQVLLDSYLET